MHSRLAITGKGDNIGQLTLGSHRHKCRLKRRSNLLTVIKAARTAIIPIPTALTVDAVKCTQLRLKRQQIDTERES